MNNTAKPCFMETVGQPQERSALAAAGSTQAPADIRLPVAATLQHSRGQAYRKVVPEDQENSVDPFFHWGLPAHFEDQKASLTMVDKAKPVIDTGNASFAFVYTKNFAVECSEFEKNSHFEEQRPCGSGASGEVRAYRDEKNNVPFVRKRIKKGKGLRPEEVKSLIRLSHPGICRLYALLVHGSTVDLLLQDAGFPLRDCLKEFLRKSISAVRYWQVVIDLGNQGFEALKYMHQQGICHLDIKPENLLVNQNSQRNLVLVLADFGASLALEQAMLPFQMQLTLEYWPPEMWQHVGSYLASLPTNQGASMPRSDTCQLPPKPAFDTFAMGLVVYFMCTLQHFVQEWERKKDTADTAVPQADIQQVCQHFGSRVGPDIAFKLLLMTDYRHQLQALVKHGDWLFPDFSPPPALLEVMVGTVNPDPENRWTDEQAACCLAGNSPDTTAEGSETESELKPPTQVDDAATDGVEHTDVVDAVVQGHMLTQEPCRLFAVDGNATASNPLERFQKEIAPFLTAWDKNASTAYSSAPQRLGEGVAHSIPTPTSMFLAAPTDIALRPAELSASGSSVFKAGASFAPGQRMLSGDSIVKTRDGQDSVIVDHTQTGQDVDGVVDLEMKMKVVSMPPGVLDLPAPPDPPADADKGAKVPGFAEGWLQLCSPSAKVGGADSCLAPRCDAAIVHLATDLVALSMQSRAKFAERQTSQPPLASPGKGGGGGKAPKVGGKAGKHGRAPYKGVARSASMKANSPGKPSAVALRGKKRLPEVPFVVVSSSRPRPSIRTMQGLSGAPAHPAGGAAPVSPDPAASPQWPGALQHVAGVPMQSLKAVQSPCGNTDTDTGWINPWAVVSAGQADSPEMLPAPEHGAPCEHQVFDLAPPQPAEAVVQQPVPDPNQGQAGCGAAQLQPSQADDTSIARLLELLEADQATQGLQGDALHTFFPAEPLGEQVAEAGPGMTVVEPSQAVDVGHLMQLGFDLSAQAGPVGQPMQQGLALDQLMQQDFAAPVDQLMQQGFAESETGPVNQLMQQRLAVLAEVAPMDQLMPLGFAESETGPVDQLMQHGFAESDQAGSLDQMMTQPGSAASVQVEPVDEQGGRGSIGEALHAASMVNSPVDTQGNVPNFDMLFDL